MPESPGTEPTAAQVGAELACQMSIHSFAKNIDSGVATANVDLFTEDGEMGSAEHSIKGREQLAFVKAARDADVERRTRHQITNIVFHRTGADAAIAQSLLCVYVLGGADELTARAITVFDDEFVRDSVGRWRFSRRFATTLAGGR
ncbi:hypothetical protein BRW65_13350 [Mycobacterium paraffinicum]|uniref:SnoaL-like domain-containing protein n=1 Tax=Mycobacterium paraffinicum TaxID=53378 RepID=A0A1Q4HUC1_9MYCO|nr:nuclear transport factor 2 family protein [Mycobacterium paraffinicum]OJZ73276.1 hypothetical protein BRW65_13350 [Mycobacterium paraffinicum]